MALDRVIQLHLRAEGTRNDKGEYVPGDFADPISVWANVADGGSSELFVGGATVIGRRARFLIRWRQDVLDHGPRLVQITDYRGDRFDCELITDYQDRRRFLHLTGTTYDGRPTP